MKNLSNASAISGADFIVLSSILLIWEMCRILPHLRELSSFISSHVFRGSFLLSSKLSLKYCPLALFVSFLVK